MINLHGRMLLDQAVMESVTSRPPVRQHWLSHQGRHRYVMHPDKQFFLFLNENICCGYSLAATGKGTSNEYPHGEIRELSKASDKMLWSKRCWYFSNSFMKTCWYTLEAPHPGPSSGYPTIHAYMFLHRKKKNIYPQHIFCRETGNMFIWIHSSI